MVSDLRAEVGHSLIAGQGTNMVDTLKYQLKRTQYELYRGYDWPALIISEQKPVPANSRHLPEFDNVDKEQINELWCKQGTEWYPITYGIDPMHYSLYDPDSGVVGFPIQRYEYDELAEQLEIWPLTSIDTKVLAKGQILLPPLIADDDKSLLDGTLIVMYAAAHMLAPAITRVASPCLRCASSTATEYTSPTPSTTATRPTARPGNHRPIPMGPSLSTSRSQAVRPLSLRSFNLNKSST